MASVIRNTSGSKPVCVAKLYEGTRDEVGFRFPLDANKARPETAAQAADLAEALETDVRVRFGQKIVNEQTESSLAFQDEYAGDAIANEIRIAFGLPGARPGTRPVKAGAANGTAAVKP